MLKFIEKKRAKVSRRMSDNDCEGVRIDGLKGGGKESTRLRRNFDFKQGNRTSTWQECQNNKTRKGEHRPWQCNPSP
jgi:hypothetical protein